MCLTTGRVPFLSACVVASAAWPAVGHAQATVTWDGVTHSTWTQPDSTSWSGATYQSGDTAVFAGAVDRQRLRIGRPMALRQATAERCGS